MTDDSARFHLPLLQAGQAQKETTHNEALTRLDMIVQASAVAMGVDDPPPAPAIGQCWILGSTPTGAWAGRAGALAGWTAGGWRFVAAVEGMAVTLDGGMLTARHHAGEWSSGLVSARRLIVDGMPVIGPRRPAIATPAGGGTTDVAARQAIGEILETLREHGLIGR